MKKVKKEKKVKVVNNDKAVFIFDKIRESLNLPTSLTQKKRKFKITITAEKYKIGEIIFKPTSASEVKVIKSNGIFSVKSIAKIVKSILKEIKKDAREQAKLLRKEMKESAKADKKAKGKKKKDKAVKVKKEKKGK